MVFGVYSIIELQTLSNLTQKMYKHPFAVSVAVRDVNLQIVSINNSMKDIALAKNQAEIQNAITKINSYEKETFKYFDILEKRFLGNKEKVNEARNTFTSWKTIRDEIISSIKKGDKKYATKISKEKDIAYINLLNKKVDYLKDFANTKGSSFNATAQAEGKRALITTIIILFD